MEKIVVSLITLNMQIFNPTNQRDRTDYIVMLYRQIDPTKTVTKNTKIKNTSIEKLCETGGGPYLRIKKWCEDTLQKKEEESKPKVDHTMFESGAPRDKRDHKQNYMSYFYPDFIIAYGKHMKKGEQYGKASFKLGMPANECFESMFRHTMAIWMELEYGRDSQIYKDFCKDQDIDPNEVHEMAAVFNLQQIWKWKEGRYEEKIKNNNPNTDE